MIYKGLIIDVKNNYAFVMTEQAEFFKVIKKDDMHAGKQIIFLDDDICKDKEFKRFGIIKYAAVFIILFVSVVFLSQFSTLNEISYMPIAVVSVDINPSVEFEINNDYKVMKIVSRNNEGDFIASENMIGNDLEEALFNLLLKAESEKYITEEKNSVLIGISVLDEKLVSYFNYFEINLSKKIKNNDNLKYIDIVMLQGEKEYLDISRQKDLSVGKYLFFLKINKEGIEIKLDDVKTMTTQDLLNYPKQHRNRYQGNEFEKPSKNSIDETLNINSQEDITHLNGHGKSLKESSCEDDKSIHNEEHTQVPKKIRNRKGRE